MITWVVSNGSTVSLSVGSCPSSCRITLQVEHLTQNLVTLHDIHRPAALIRFASLLPSTMLARRYVSVDRDSELFTIIKFLLACEVHVRIMTNSHMLQCVEFRTPLSCILISDSLLICDTQIVCHVLKNVAQAMCIILGCRCWKLLSSVASMEGKNLHFFTFSQISCLVIISVFNPKGNLNDTVNDNVSLTSSSFVTVTMPQMCFFICVHTSENKCLEYVRYNHFWLGIS